jgi:SET domain-containing protein
MILPFLTIATSTNRGRGVFTTEPISANTTIEIAPVIVVDANDREKLEQTLLYDYIFEWGEDHKMAAVALGYISIYNHSNQPNCAYDMDIENQTISITTLTNIELGAELFINYMCPEGPSSDPVWFEQH